MICTLVMCEGENNARSFQNPSPEAIDRTIDDLIPAEYHFVVLEQDPQIEKCTYVQTLIEREGKFNGLYLVEARYAFPDGFRHYRKHIGDAGELKTLFQMFAKGIAPNTAGWDDITERIITAAG